MKIDFDFAAVSVTEFGVGRDEEDEQTFALMPVDANVQAALREMTEATWDALQRDTDGPTLYDPSEKHGSTEYLYLPLDDVLATPIRELHQAANLPLDIQALADPASIFCYFARMTDAKGRRLTALRRATQFKGVLKTRGLLRIETDALRLIKERVFKLDADFDLLVDSSYVHILRPTAFEFAGHLQEAIMGAVPHNIAAIQKDLKFVAFANIEDYAGKHPRAARYLASIRALKETSNIDKNALKRLCKSNGVEISESKGTITVSAGHELDFLEVLDRRRYQLELVKDSPERFRAGSRKKIDG